MMYSIQLPKGAKDHVDALRTNKMRAPMPMRFLTAVCHGSLVAAGLLLGGCIIFPVGKPKVSAIPMEKDLSFIRSGQTTRSEVIDRVGAFDKEYLEGKIGYRKWSVTHTKNLTVVFPGIPIGTSNPETEVEAALFLFDDNDLVQRFEIVRADSSERLESRVLKWIED